MQYCTILVIYIFNDIIVIMWVVDWKKLQTHAGYGVTLYDVTPPQATTKFNNTVQCRYRFSWKAISTCMSLTLARLCGEWRLVSKIYGARSGQYEAWIAIFRIFAAIDRFSRISRKVESRWRNRKAVEEDFLGFLGNQKAVEENWILIEENWSLLLLLLSKIVCLFSTFARTYFVVLHVVQKLLGGRHTYPPF